MGATGDKFIAVILSLIQGGFGLLQGEVFGLTGIMITLTFALLGIRFMLSGEEGKAVVGQFFMTLLYVGFLSWVITAWPTLYQQVGGYFQELGGVAGKVADAGQMMHKPSRVLESLDLAKAPIEKAMDDMSGGMKGLWNSGKVMTFAFALWLLEAAFLILYVNLFFAVVEFHLVSLAAWPFLAFSAFKGSAFLAERPLGFVFAAGAKLFVMAMITGFSMNFFDASLPPVNPTINQALDAAVMAFLIMVLGFAVPVAAAALISGGPGLSAALPMATALGAAMVVKEGVAAARQTATSAPAKAIGSATATAAGRAANSFNQSFAQGGAANMAQSAMRGGNAARAAAPAAGGAAGRASSATAGTTRTAPTGGAWDGPPSGKQAYQANKRGVDISGMTKGQASLALEQAGMDDAWGGAKGSTPGAAGSAPETSRGSNAVAGMKSAYNRGPARSGAGHKTDFLQRVRSAIPPGTEGQASGNAPSLSRDL